MSFEIVTRNRGAVDRFGFMGSIIREIGMGSLPPMPRAEFCAYAPMTVIESLLLATPEQLKLIRDDVKECEDSLRKQNNGYLPILDKVPAEMRRKIYRINPFWVCPEDNTISIGELYNGIDITDFSCYTLDVLGGGHFGWVEGEIPDEAVQGFRLIKGAVSRL